MLKLTMELPQNQARSVEDHLRFPISERLTSMNDLIGQ
jgi:hypothetical protein